MVRITSNAPTAHVFGTILPTWADSTGGNGPGPIPIGRALYSKTGHPAPVEAVANFRGSAIIRDAGKTVWTSRSRRV